MQQAPVVRLVLPRLFAGLALVLLVGLGAAAQTPDPGFGPQAAGGQLSVAIRPANIDRVDAGVQRISSEVSIHVDGATRVARFEIQEEFRNLTGRLMEGDYLYPIPPGAMFTDLSLFMGETELKGEMLPADQARAIYEEIVRRRKDPALVELVGNGVVRARVFPIEPGQTRKIILRFAQVLPRDGDTARLRYPRTASLIDVHEAAPREHTVERLSHVPQPPRFALRVRIDSASRFGTPFSPTSAIDVQRRDGDVAEVVLRDTGAAPANFELLLPLARDSFGATLLTHSPAPGTEDGYFLLLFNPPPADRVEAIPRDVTLVMDVSGSMSGHKLIQARAALEQVLHSLGSDDRFRVITFSSAVRTFAESWTAATPDDVRSAADWLRAAAADGSTNLYGALEAALAPQAIPGRLSLVMFLTDGKPTVSETDPELIAAAAEQLHDGERVFAFGVGEDVNTYLLDRLAEGGRGAVSYVRPDENVEAAVSTLTRKIGAPVLTDLRIAGAPVTLEDPYPSLLPDLFEGEELLLLGRYRGSGEGDLVLTGARGGHRVRLAFPLAFARQQPDNGFVARLWASRKAGALTSQIRLHGADPEVVEEIRQLGLRYGVLTEYTSFLVEEPLAQRMDIAEFAGQLREQVPDPVAQTGNDAFRKSRASSELRAAQSVAEADAVLGAAARQPASLSDGRANAEGSWTSVNRRLFRFEENAWMDVARDEDAASLSVAPYSEAWFELLVRLPGLRQAAGLGESVIIAGDGLTLRLEAGGESTLDAADWQRIERAFATDRR